MQVGIDIGATKIESVVLEKDGQEKHRSRIPCPKNYTQIVTSIRDIHRQLNYNLNKNFQLVFVIQEFTLPKQDWLKMFLT